MYSRMDRQSKNITPLIHLLDERKHNDTLRTYPLQQFPDVGVEADGNAVECTVKTTPTQPLALSVSICSCWTIFRCCNRCRQVQAQAQRNYLLHSLRAQASSSNSVIWRKNTFNMLYACNILYMQQLSVITCRNIHN